MDAPTYTAKLCFIGNYNLIKEIGVSVRINGILAMETMSFQWLETSSTLLSLLDLQEYKFLNIIEGGLRFSFNSCGSQDISW